MPSLDLSFAESEWLLAVHSGCLHATPVDGIPDAIRESLVDKGLIGGEPGALELTPAGLAEFTLRAVTAPMDFSTLRAPVFFLALDLPKRASQTNESERAGDVDEPVA